MYGRFNDDHHYNITRVICFMYNIQFTGSQESFLHVEVEEVTNDFDVYQFARGRSFMDTAQNSRTVTQHYYNE